MLIVTRVRRSIKQAAASQLDGASFFGGSEAGERPKERERLGVVESPLSETRHVAGGTKTSGGSLPFSAVDETWCTRLLKA